MLERQGYAGELSDRIGRRGLRLLSPTGLEEAADPALRAS